MEGAFKFLFFIGVLLYSLISIGIFFVIVRIILLFASPVHFMGFTIS